MLTEEQTNALRAALHRVEPNLTRAEFQIELAWAVRTCVITKDGYIGWRFFELGQKLFLALAECQAWRCCYCGVDTTMEKGPAQATLEHVTPKAAGGLDHPANLVMACSHCNHKQGEEYCQGLTR